MIYSKRNWGYIMAKNKSIDTNNKVLFKDVAGYEKEKIELNEIKDFLINSEKYVKIGAHIPKGLMLTGLPGVGKTLITRALAGESKVPLFEINSSIISKHESFASAIEEIFEQAHENSPSIIFIDEIHRLVGNYNNAYEDNHKMLNQLLVEMDGIDSSVGIIVVATANHLGNIDGPLLRPGRFDRHIHFPLPDFETRKLILQFHAKNKKLSHEVSFDELAQITEGSSGADLATVLNEAAILSVRDKSDEIKLKHLDEALDRVNLRGIRNNKKRDDEGTRRIAIHEAGHTVVALEIDADRIEKVTIQGINNVGGFVKMSSDAGDFYTKNQLFNKIVKLYGGRIAENLVFNEPSTLSDTDLTLAKTMATNMIINHGMTDYTLVVDNYEESNEIAERRLIVSREVDKILKEGYEKAENIIKSNLNLLNAISDNLIIKKTLSKEDLITIKNSIKSEW
jgi:cell division protease FtsH